MTQGSPDPALPAHFAESKIALEEQLRNLRADNERLTAAIATMGGVAHDLNNRLTGILGFSQLLQDCQTSDTARRYVTMLEDEARRFGEIVGSLSYFAKPAGLKIRVDLQDVVERTLKLRGDSLRRDKITIDLVREPNLPEVLAEAQQLMQVFLNLIIGVEQGIRETRAPGVLRIRLGRSGDCVRISFSCAVSNHAPLRELRPTDGFEIYKSVIRAHHGELEINNTEGNDAEFLVTLPVTPPAYR